MSELPADDHSDSTYFARPTFYRYFVLVFLGLASVNAYLTRYCISSAQSTMTEELSLSLEQMGWILAIFNAGYCVFQVPGGWLGDRLGTRWGMSIISVFWAAATACMALATGFVSLFSLRVASGAGQAGLVPISARIVRDWFPDSSRGFASSVISAAMSVGGVFALFFTGQLLMVMSWQNVFLLYSAIGVLWSLSFYAMFRTRPEDHPLVNSAEVAVIRHRVAPPVDEFAEQIPANTDTAATEPPEAQASAVDSGLMLVWVMLTSRSMWAICFQSFFRAAGYSLFVTWFPGILEKRFGLTVAAASGYASLPLVCLICGTLFGGWAVDFVLRTTGSKWKSRSGVAVFATTMAALSIGATSLAPNSILGGTTKLTGSLPFVIQVMLDLPVYFYIAMMSSGAFFAGLSSPSAWAGTMDVAGKYTAPVMGTMNMAGTFGAFALPVLLGYRLAAIQKSGNWNEVVFFVSAIYFAAAVSWMIVNPNKPVAEE